LDDGRAGEVDGFAVRDDLEAADLGGAPAVGALRLGPHHHQDEPDEGRGEPADRGRRLHDHCHLECCVDCDDVCSPDLVLGPPGQAPAC